MVPDEVFLKKVVAYLNDPENADIHDEIGQLIKEFPENEKVYNQVVEIWHKSADLRRIEALDMDQAVLEIEARLAGSAAADPIVGHPRIGIKNWIAAASVAAAVLMTGLAYWQYRTQVEPQTYLVKTTGDATDSLKLSDQSKIYLDAHTCIRYPKAFLNKNREISLMKGQAFFSIHRDTLHPFVVDVNLSRVTVLGTSFNIDSRNKAIALNVNTGLVKFQPRADRADGAILHAGTGIIYYETTARLEILESVNKNSNAWLTHNLDFVDASLTEVCKQMENYYKVTIRLSGNIAAFKKLNANFKENKITEVLEVLEGTYPIKVKKTGKDKFLIQSIIK